MTHLPGCERQPLWEGGERSKLLILSPPNGFLSRSLFHNPPLSFGKRIFSDGSHDFSRRISFPCVLCSIMETCSFTSPSIGGWGRRKAGDWGRKPGRGRGIAAGLPPFPGLSPQASGKTLLRRPSTQSIKDNTQGADPENETNNQYETAQNIKKKIPVSSFLFAHNML